MKARRILGIALPALAVTLAIGISFARRGEVLCDDAYISFRYARNLATGHGLVWNPGERVEGYSNLSYTLVLALGAWLGLPLPLVAQLVGAAAAVACLASVAALAACMDVDRTAGWVCAAALGVTVPFSAWTFRGLETAPFTALLVAGAVVLARDVERGGPPSWGACALFGLAAVTRPEGFLYVAAAALALGFGPVPVRHVARFVKGAGLAIVAQLALRLLYYGDALPNTYYAKVWKGPDRWWAGAAYLLKSGREAGPALVVVLLLGLAAGVAGRRRAADRLCLFLAATALFFAVSSGGDGFPDGRFLYPFLPFALVLAVRAAPRRFRLPWAVVVFVVALGSPWLAMRGTARGRVVPLHTLRRVIGAAGAGDRAARAWLERRFLLLARSAPTPQARVGRWLREHLPPDALVAVGDCGQIPFESGLRTIDTVGLMDRHIARLPGPRHGKVDLPYVLGRGPRAVVLRLTGLGSGLPFDMRLVTDAGFLDGYRLALVEPYGGQHYFVFVARGELPPAARAAELDVTALVGSAVRTATAPDGARAAGAFVRAGYRYVELPRERIAELEGRLASAGSSGVDGLSPIEDALRELAPLTHHGIVFQLPERWPAGALEIELGPFAEGSELRFDFGFAPWLLREGLTHEAARLEVRLTGHGGSVTGATMTLDPVSRPDDRTFRSLAIPLFSEPHGAVLHVAVSRAGPDTAHDDPFEVMVGSPVVTTRR